MKKKILCLVALTVFIPSTAYAMHIGEGFLPVKWAVFYYILCLPFLYLGLRDIRSKTSRSRDLKMLLGLAAAYCFVLSALKLPSVAGSSSHLTGAGFGALLFGPFSMSIIGSVVLLFQALFLAHGGITTLGANAFSMAVAGPMVSYAVYRMLKNKNKTAAVFLAGMLGDIATYAVTSIQLALAFPAKAGGVAESLVKFASIFAVTQIPLAIIEGILTVAVFNFVYKYCAGEISMLSGEA